MHVKGKYTFMHAEYIIAFNILTRVVKNRSIDAQMLSSLGENNIHLEIIVCSHMCWFSTGIKPNRPQARYDPRAPPPPICHTYARNAGTVGHGIPA